MSTLPTFNKWATAFINFIKPNTKAGARNLSGFIKSNSRGLICGTIFLIIYVIVPMFYSSIEGNTWTGQYTQPWLLGIYPASALLALICSKSTKSATTWESVTSGLLSGLITALPLLIPLILLLTWRSIWMLCLIFTGNATGKEPLALAIFAVYITPIPFVVGLGGMIRNLYFHFTRGSDSTIIKSLTKIAEQGDIQSQLDLARIYYDGEDTPQDYIKAAEWLTKAANQGNAEAQCGLGIIYFDGLGTEKDYKKAADWWTKAANQDYERAQKNLEVMNNKGLIPKWIMPAEEKKSVYDAAAVTKDATVEQSVPDTESKSKKGMGWLLPVFLLVFGILGWHTGMCFVFLFRSLFGAGILFVKLIYFIIFVGLTLFAFYKFQIIRHTRNSTQCLGINTLFMGLLVFLMGAVVWRMQWVNPMQKFIKTFEDERLACQTNAKEVLSVSGVTESHVPGSGYILVKATLLAKQPLIINGEDWMPKDSSSNNHPFSSVPEWTELQPGQPKEINIAIVNAANRKYVPTLTADGPYFFPEIRVYVTNPTRSKESCKITLIKGLTTKAYKASEFGTAAIHMPGDKGPDFARTVIHLPGGKKISPAKIIWEESKPKPSDEDPLEKEARKLLQDAEQLLDEANKEK